MTLGPQAPEGIRNFPIRLVTDAPISGSTKPGTDEPLMHELRAYVQANVTAMVSATPGFVSFGLVRPGQVLHRSVQIEGHDEFKLKPTIPIRIEGLRGQEFEHADSFTASLHREREGNALVMKLQLQGLPDGTTGSFGGVVMLDVGHPLKEQLAIRFSGVCRPGVPGNEDARVPPRLRGAFNGAKKEDSHVRTNRRDE